MMRLAIICCVAFAPLVGAAEKLDARALAALIDRHVAARLEQANVRPAPPADDATYLRRLSLDVAGRIPTAADARAYLDDKDSHKREKLIDRLLDGPGFVAHSTNTWKALLVPEDNPSNFQLRTLMPSFEVWLRRRFAQDVTFDKVVRELLTASLAIGGQPPGNFNVAVSGEPSPAAFYQAKELKPEELASATSRLFLGVKLECAQCHNHPFAKWTRQQFWEFAAFFSGVQPTNPNGPRTPTRERVDRREIAIPNSPLVVQAAFLDGREPKWKHKVGARVTLADWITSPENPWFGRAAANRVWAQMFGIGLVDPVDDLSDDTNAPSHPELLDTLARQFVLNGYDLKYLIRAVALSKTYGQSSAANDETGAEPRLFARMALKGLTVDQLFDSLVVATGYREQRQPQQAFVVPTGPRADFAARFAAADKRTESATSILQALALMNGSFVADATSAQRGETLGAVVEAPFLDDAGRIETLFLAALSRRPTAAEQERLAKYVASGGPRKDPKAALGDVFWALLNGGEFLLNH